MAHRTDRNDPAQPLAAPALTDLEASLARLGVREVEERLELSPLLTTGDVQDNDYCHCECTCDTTPDLPYDPLTFERLHMASIGSSTLL
jgi:hypothetical protein